MGVTQRYENDGYFKKLQQSFQFYELINNPHDARIPARTLAEENRLYTSTASSMLIISCTQCRRRTTVEERTSHQVSLPHQLK